MLERAAAKLRGASRSHKQTTAHENRTATAGRESLPTADCNV